MSKNNPADGDSLSREVEMRKVMDGHHVEYRDWLFKLMEESSEEVFKGRRVGCRVFVSPDYNGRMEEQREANMERIEFLLSNGVFEGWAMMINDYEDDDSNSELKKLAGFECLAVYDHSLSVKLGVQFLLWGGAIQFLGTKRHHDKWLKDTESYAVKGCFAMTELGHGSNVRGIETIATYDSSTDEFVINTPCETAQKYWIGGAANHATHAVVFCQLHINGKNEGIHAIIVQLREEQGNVCPCIRIADCGHKNGLNGVDNGRIWFDNVRVPRENLLNSVADVCADGKYVTDIKDPDQRFRSFLAPLTCGRVNISANSIYQAKIGLAIAIRYSLTRRAFSQKQSEPETLLLDYPSHQRRLLPLLAKTVAMSCAANKLKKAYVKRTPKDAKSIHVYSSAFKAMSTWHNMRTLQECREACGGQGYKTENRIGHLKGEYDIQSTFEGDNLILLQQVSKALLSEYTAAEKHKKPFEGLGLEHMNLPCPVVPEQLTPATVRSSKFQSDMFCLRERDLLIQFSGAVSQHMTQGKSKELAVIQCYQLAEDLAQAFSERAILQAVFDCESDHADGRVFSVLGLLRTMYALICMEENVSFLRYGYLSVKNAAVVREEVAKLCEELRPLALSLVSSFGIPDAYLSPLAFDWVEANSWSST